MVFHALIPIVMALAAPAPPGAPADPPTITLKADNTVIDRSCRVVIPPGTVIEDADGNGVIQITAPGVVMEFAPGSVLRGAAPGVDPDHYTGTGIRIKGQKDVTLRGVVVSGYKAGLWATAAPGLTIENADASDNFHQRLRSTPQAEDGADWMSFHHNDKNEALETYGAAMYIEDSDNITVRNCRVRHGQNALIIDRVNGARIYDNEFSFNSGWGIGMWRSGRNTISRNAIDFCVRGHSEGVYNRGQDSAGIICFEQCSSNIIAENSVTHGGDCFFGFAGLEALNGEGAPPDFDFTRKGCNDNLLIENDLSYAPAHGIEMTFSFGNKFIRNRLVENAICGVWGGYSQDTIIAENEFDGNGGMAYGLERGGVNIEHGANNLILNNRFVNNMCAVHLWWHDNGDFATKTWGKANYKGVVGNAVMSNTFVNDANHPFKNLRPDQKFIVLQVRDESREHNKVAPIRWGNNSTLSSIDNVETMDVASGLKLVNQSPPPAYEVPRYEALGTTRPVGARPRLRGRDNIIMTQWGPWDHESPLVRLEKIEGGDRLYSVRKLPLKGTTASVTGDGISGAIEAGPGDEHGTWTYRVHPTKGGLLAYSFTIANGDFHAEFHDAILNTVWDLAVFPWAAGPNQPAPPPDLEKWRAAASGPDAAHATVGALRFAFGGRGPSDLNISPAITAAKFRGDYFGIIATTKVPLPKGKWRLKTVSDDGIRVIADGKTVIERWTHHGAENDEAVLDLPADKTVDLTVEYFEIFGGAVLEFQIEPVN